jgi:Ca-activated chloride channel family protein
MSRAYAEERVTINVDADTPAVLTGSVHRITARVLLKPHAPSENERPRIAAALVIDKSGSMKGEGKMENARRGALEALRQLSPEDKVAVIAYDDEAFVIAGAVSVKDGDKLRRAISNIRAGGNTALYDGVILGAREIGRFAGSGYVPRIILLSDGMANVGPSSVNELAQLGRKLSRGGTTITTIGLGLDYDEDLMTALASESGGNAYFAKTSDRLEDIFRRDLEDAAALTGREVRITISCDGAVKPVRPIGREGRTGSDFIEVGVDNLYGAEKYAIFELEIPASDEEATLKAGTVRVEYTDATSGLPAVHESPLIIEYTKDAQYAESKRDAEVAAQAETARNAEILEDAVRLADEGRAAEAAKMLKERADKLAAASPADDAAAQSEISYFSSLADGISEEGEMTNEQRKSSVNKAYTTKNQQSDIND